MNRLTDAETAELAARIRAKQWGWKAAFESWYTVHGDSPSFELLPDGSRVLTREPPEFIKTNLSNLAALGLDDVVQPDGTLVLDAAGEVRYRPLGDLADGFTAYERVPAESVEVQPDRRAIQCNYREGTTIAAMGARAYVILANLGGGHDRIEVLVRSRGRRWVRKWESMRRLTDFRLKTLPPEHPQYGVLPDWDAADVGDEWLPDLVQRLNRASAEATDGGD
jgi:hypothetical protein